MKKGRSIARLLLKTAVDAHGAGLTVGSALRKAVGAGTKGLEHAGNFGAGTAKALGGDAELGALAGKGVAVVGAGTVASKMKRKVDEWRYRHGLYNQQQY